MQGHKPISDHQLLLGAFFTAVVFVAVGVLGQNPPQQMAAAPQDAMTAAAGATTPAPSQPSIPAKQACLPTKETNQATINTTCYPGCHYVVNAGSLLGRATLTATTQYSDGSKNPGDVRFEVGTTWKTQQCHVGSDGNATLGDANGSVGYDTLRGVIGSPASDPNNYINVVQPSGAATPAAQTSAPVSSQTSGSTPAPGQPGNWDGMQGDGASGVAPSAGSGCTVPGGLLPGEVCSYSNGQWGVSFPNSVNGSQVPGPGEAEADPGFNGNDAQALKEGTFDDWGPGSQAGSGDIAPAVSNSGSPAPQPKLVGTITPPNETLAFVGLQTNPAPTPYAQNEVAAFTTLPLSSPQVSSPDETQAFTGLPPIPAGSQVLSTAPAPVLSGAPNPADYANTTDYYNAEIAYYNSMTNLHSP